MKSNTIIIFIYFFGNNSMPMNKKNISWIPSHPIAGSEVSGPKFGNENLFSNKWCM